MDLSNEEDDGADALDSGRQNLDRARSMEQFFSMDPSPKVAPPVSMLEYVIHIFCFANPQDHHSESLDS